MFNGFCHLGNWGSLVNFGAWGWLGMILNLVIWIGLFTTLVLLVVWTIRRARVPAAQGLHASVQPTAKEILQARYAQGEITREQYLQMLDDLS